MPQRTQQPEDKMNTENIKYNVMGSMSYWPIEKGENDEVKFFFLVFGVT